MILLWNSAAMTVEAQLVTSDQPPIVLEWQADRNLARDMLGYLRDQLAMHGKTLQELEGIGVFLGPGSYTGLRIGMTVLNTLAVDQQIPIVGATGDDWQSVTLSRLRAGENDQLVLPEYGAAVLTTKPRK